MHSFLGESANQSDPDLKRGPGEHLRVRCVFRTYREKSNCRPYAAAHNRKGASKGFLFAALALVISSSLVRLQPPVSHSFKGIKAGRLAVWPGVNFRGSPDRPARAKIPRPVPRAPGSAVVGKPFLSHRFFGVARRDSRKRRQANTWAPTHPPRPTRQGCRLSG